MLPITPQQTFQEVDKREPRKKKRFGPRLGYARFLGRFLGMVLEEFGEVLKYFWFNILVEFGSTRGKMMLTNSWVILTMFSKVSCEVAA